MHTLITLIWPRARSTLVLQLLQPRRLDAQSLKSLPMNVEQPAPPSPPPNNEPPWETPHQSPPPYAIPPAPYPPPSLAPDLLFRIIFGGSMALLALLMIIGFFAFNWVATPSADDVADKYEDALDDADDYNEFYEELRGLSLSEVADNIRDSDFDDDDSLDHSAWTIWSGGEEEAILLLDPNKQPEDGFDNVRLVDRILILLPILGAILLIVAVIYGMGYFRISTFLWVSIILSILLTAFPFVWQLLSTSEWKIHVYDLSEAEYPNEFYQMSDDARDEFGNAVVAITSAAYSTGEQVALGLIALLISGGGLFIHLMMRRSPMPYQMPTYTPTPPY